jgi:general secretion pathway protein A
MYLEFYKLKREPFCLTPDPKFLHLADPHRNALVALVQGVLRRRGFMVATGPVGTGKTTILNALLYLLSNLHKSGERKLVSAFLVNPLLTRDEFLESLLDEFEVQVSSTTKPRRLLALHELFLKAQSGGGTAILIIDEAHLLTVELLEDIRLLTNMDTHREKLLQVILCGQPELASLLLQPQLRALRQRIALLAQLRPLTTGETAAYIEQRLRLAGLEGPSPFAAPASLEEIYRRTQGVPRLINLLCDGCLTISFQMHRKELDVEMVRAAAAGLTLVAPTAAPLPGNGSSPAGGNGSAPATLEAESRQHLLSPRIAFGETVPERTAAGGKL